ncbi:ABC transporter permease [Microbacterium hominis]|uniref:ABC transporter permease n=1 Tax=Microbacterium hominis TaxID=162426 RepID=A0A7D4PWG0_9MICO|nr:ABC transporter permease [Microbacterium hominis]QKJ20474.1 ABC transporter permease [Microbacterium hominis]
MTTLLPTRPIALRRKTARSPRRRAPRWLLVAAEVAVPLLLLAAWWIASANSTNTFFPPLQVILERLVALSQTPQFAVNVGSSLLNLVISFALASVIGVVLGSLLGLIRPLAWFVEPTLHFFRAIPPVALVPIFVSLIGFGNETRILSITLAALFPTLIAAIDGVRAVDPITNMVTRVYGIPAWQRFWQVVLPAASPRVFSGMQVSLQVAFIVMIASEMLGSSTGLGAATLLAQQSFAIADMWAGILLLGVIGYASSALFALLRRRVLRWYIASQQMGKDS